jgi:ribosomal protein L30E
MQKDEETILTHERLETFTHSGKSLRDFKNMVNVIKKEKPEVLLIASWIFQNKSNDNINYLFVKSKASVLKKRTKNTN